MQHPIAPLLRQLRREHGLTQSQLAERIHVSAKAVSKWERGAGFPSAALIPALAAALGVSSDALLDGRFTLNPPDGGNMKRISFYQCPICGDLLTATGKPDISCCGRQLTPMTPQPADDLHRLAVTDVEDEKLVRWTHPMEKSHHLTFLAEVGPDSVHLVRLYPEGAQEHRMPRIPWGTFFCGCTEAPGILFTADPPKKAKL